MFLVVCKLLALKCILVSSQSVFQSRLQKFHHVEPSFIMHRPVVHGFLPVANTVVYTLNVPSVFSRISTFLVLATAVNRVLGRNRQITLTPDTTPLIMESTTTQPPTTTKVCSFSAILSNCGQTGSSGPNLSQCMATYNTVWSNDNARFNVIDGVQILTIPDSGRYRIEAYGAEGGTGDDGTFPGGKGAKIVGEFIINEGTMLNIVIGQKGVDGRVSEPAGGGGGTFVYTGTIGGSGLLIAAGGGGGGGEEATRNGFDGQAGENALGHLGLSGNVGFGGNGGTLTSAGAGWKSDGGQSTDGNSKPGTRWNGGDLGSSSIAAGGFGGGGSGVSSNGGGGGGGYTGGDGTTELTGGSGAGSFNSGSNQNNQTGINTGPGRLQISCISNI